MGPARREPITLEEVGLEAAADTCRTVPLPSGRSVEIAMRGEERVRVRGRSGAVELTVVLGAGGPRLIFEAADLEIHATDRLSIDCRQLEVRATESLTMTGARTKLEATRGDLELRANDNVVAVGEEIRLNCDAPDVVPDWLAEAIGARLPAPARSR